MNRVVSFAAAAAVATLASEASAGGTAKIGDKVSHSFTQPMVNDQGVKSLADLAGRPVLVEFWGTR
jgi:hypothetical protein